MIKYKLFSWLIILLAVALGSSSPDYHVRIGIIGNSITEGSFLSNPETQCYPAQLAVMLEEKYGDTCILKNFGITTTTMLKKGDVPYWNSAQFKNCLDFTPEICFIMLGTNDSKPYNWDVYGDEFIDDYMAMIDTLKSINPFVKFIVCYPPPAFDVVFNIRDSVIFHGVIPAVDSIVYKTGAELVDFYHPLLDSVSLFPDKIHPNIRGAKAMARIAFDRIVEMDIVHKVKQKEEK